MLWSPALRCCLSLWNSCSASEPQHISLPCVAPVLFLSPSTPTPPTRQHFLRCTARLLHVLLPAAVSDLSPGADPTARPRAAALVGVVCDRFVDRLGKAGAPWPGAGPAVGASCEALRDLGAQLQRVVSMEDVEGSALQAALQAALDHIRGAVEEPDASCATGKVGRCVAPRSAKRLLLPAPPPPHFRTRSGLVFSLSPSADCPLFFNFSSFSPCSH
jgi:hypothetical protein